MENKNVKIKFLQEAPNKNSANRLIFVLGSFWNMGMTTALAFAFDGITTAGLLAFFTGVQSVFVGLKVLQKPNENK